jgi:hypothetical protein
MMAEKMSGSPIPPGQSQVPKKIVRAAPVKRDRNILWQGLLLYLGAISVLAFGFIGYWTYEDYVEPNLKIFVCCVPSIVIALILIFFGFSTRVNMVRSVRQPQVIVRKVPMQDQDLQIVDVDGKMVTPSRLPSDSSNEGLKKYQVPTVSKDELILKKDNLSEFIRNLDEQHKSGLLYDETYLELKTKYQFELNSVNQKLKRIELKKSKLKK